MRHARALFADKAPPYPVDISPIWRYIINRFIQGLKQMSDNSSIQEAIRGWRDKLLQLDRRNNRVYFKFTQSAVEIQNLLVSGVDAWAANEYRAAFRFKYAESDHAEEDSEPPVHLMLHRNASYQEEPPELQRRLRNLYKRNRLWEEEQGVSILYLAVGFLEWIDKSDETAHAPLVLIPCKLERSAPREPFTLIGRDDPEINETLRHMLSKNYSMELPDPIGQTVADILKAASQAVESRPGWSIRERIVLDCFYSSKLAMYDDLDVMSKEDKHHPLICSLASPTKATDQELQEAEAGVSSYDSDLAGGKLDDLLPLQDQYAILDADYSQLLTIDSAMKGKQKHLVVHGPPGTGKSQTIVNLIATYLAKGKRVLFVSEKKAALDVVKRWLDDRGLGVFCLDLHSGARKKEVYEQLRKSHDAMSSPMTNPAADGDVSEKLTRYRDRLNRYVRELHKKRKPLDISFFDALGRFEQARNAPEVSLKWSDIDAEQLEEIERLGGNLAQWEDNFCAHDKNRRLWGALKQDALPFDAVEQIRSRLQTLMEAVDSPRQTLLDRAKWVNVPTPATAEECRQTSKLMDLLSKGEGVPKQWLNLDTLLPLHLTAGTRMRAQKQQRKLEERLQESFGDSIPDLDYADVSRQLQTLRNGSEALKAFFGVQWETDVMENSDARLEQLDEAVEAFAGIIKAASTLGNALGMRVDSPPDLAEALQWTDRIKPLYPAPLSWLDDVNLRQTAKARMAAQKERRELEKQLQPILGRSIPDLAYADISDQLQDVQDGSEALEAFFAGRWDTDVMVNPGALLEQLDDAMDAFAGVIKTASLLGNALGMRIDSPVDLAKALRLVEQVNPLYPAPLSWLDDAADETNRSDCENWKGDLESLIRERKRLLETYNERIVDEVNPAMLGRYRRGCRSFWQRFGRAWRRDQRLLNSLQTSPDKLSRDARLLHLKYALNIQDGRNEWLQDDSLNSRRLRERFPDFKPLSFEHAAETLKLFTADFEKTVQLRDNWNGSQTLLRSLLTDQEAHDEFKEAVDKAHDAKERLNEALESIERTDLIETSDAFEQTAKQTKAARPVLETLTDSAVSEFISACKITPVCFRELVKWVENAARFRELEEEEKHEHESLQDAFGKHYQGSDTDWQAVLDALETLQGFRDDFEKTVDLRDNWNASISLLHSLLTDQQTHDDLKEAADNAVDAKESLNETLKSIGRTDLIEMSDPFAQTKGQVDTAHSLLEKLTGGAIYDVISACKSPPHSFTELVSLVGDSSRLREFEQEEEEERERLRSDFGKRYKGFDTDWQAVLNALKWTKDVLNMVPNPSDPQIQHIADPVDADEYRRAAKSMREAGGAVSSACAELDEFFDIQDTPWETWDTAPFDKLRSWAENLHRNAGGIPAYLEYETDARDLETIIGNGALSRIRNATNDAKLILDIVRRALYRGWIERWRRGVHELRDFRRIGHNGDIKEFRRLDKLQMQAAQNAVQKICFENLRQNDTMEIFSQRNRLNLEISKTRGQMSAHQLLKRIPDLLGKLKPCMLMSPLAVSQYLPRDPYDPSRLLFDAVIFDEASQIFPEDAVPAIARAKQAIVVGDEKQLPPTSFFRRALDDEEPDYDDENYEEDALAGRESVLSVMIGMVGGQVEERRLNVHYRSLHEDLIRFSNHYYYDDKLLTFPAPRISLNGEEAAAQEKDGAETQALGVRSVYLKDARYDAGGARTNRIEAEKVVEIVFDLMRTRPDDESVGIVALSLPQAELIERLIENRRLKNRDMDARFDEERHDRFFIKNLENVQGDERDHIILSVGYGPTEGSGAVPNRFGPINLKGGERRLNVAVTRARRQMIVVHSLRPEDIRAESATHEGPRLLKRYLEYIRNPRGAFEAALTVDPAAEPESPFEEQVKSALVEKGHKVDSQIGVSGYRIDLGIRSEDGRGYALGVECDGATYHSSPAARDRDRQRQDVLEGLGWTIHRVWSTAWAKNREKELEAIENVLKRLPRRDIDAV